MKEDTIHISIDNSRCRRCSYCVQICPAKAIKIEKERVRIIPERCIFCGSCVTECPQHAVVYTGEVSDVMAILKEGKTNTIACLDPAFPASLKMTPRQLVTALKRAGFTEVWEGAFGAEVVSQAYKRLLKDNKGMPIISSFCPAIVFYIQKYLPHLIPHIAPIVSPMIAIGRIARKIKGPDWKVIYITPCLAHAREQFATEVKGAVDHVITFFDMYRLLDNIDLKGLYESDFDGPRPYLARIISVVGGLNRSMGNYFDVLKDDINVTFGYKQAIGTLNHLGAGYIKVNFLDIVYCFGCVDGPFAKKEIAVIGRKQIIASYATTEMAKQDSKEVASELKRYRDIDLRREFLNMDQRLPLPTDEQIREVLAKIDKLPPDKNLDCRACGYSTCRKKAIAVVQGIAEAEYCLPYLLEQSKKLYEELEKSHKELQLSHQKLEEAQYQLIRTEKLAALGQLAAGVAHEINNPLSTITIYAHLLLRNLDPQDPRRDDVQLIIEEAARTKEIVQGLLSFAREKKMQAELTDINEIIEDVLGLLANQSIFYNIKIEKALSPNIPMITADATQLKQVFLNIILNAAEAMKGKGKLYISTMRDKDEIKIRVEDTGPGIPPEIIDKIFNPFFTTKEKGTGLGLAISYGIIERHSGKIDVESKLDKGTTFIITLPVSANKADHVNDIQATGTEGVILQNYKLGRDNHEQKN